MKKIFINIFLFLLFSGNLLAQSGSYAGSFARLGFGARGLAMGNAMVSNIYGDVAGYYNPSLACFQEDAVINLGYTFLNLDRKLNFVGLAKKFKIPNQPSGGAGITLGWINSGVGNIDIRDNDAKHLEYASTYENQFYLGTGFLLSDNFAIGVAFKLYNAKLYTDVTTSSIAFDIGALYKENDNLAFGFSVKDISARYKWETSKLYGNLGGTTENKFPTLWNLGGSYRLPNKRGSASIEFEMQYNPVFITNKETGEKSERKNNYYFKAGVEYNLSSNPDMPIIVRTGIDRIELASDDFTGNLKPGFGISFSKLFSKNVILGVDYSFQYEPYTHYPMQNLGISFKFK
ncbi:MAG TPA: hypothetical protein VIL99_02040 [Ignavibacteria bacterium]